MRFKVPVLPNLKFNASIVEAANYNGNSTLRSVRDLAFDLQVG